MYILRCLLKYTGSKRSQIPEIQRHLPETIDAYYEPFVGGASVVGNLQIQPQFKCCGDVSKPLIDFYKTFQKEPDKILEHYDENWRPLQLDPKYFYVVRDRFNAEPNPFDFFFLSRTSHNGLIRFNRKGEFNAPIAHNPDGRTRGASPESLRSVFSDWSLVLKNVEFSCQSYVDFLDQRFWGEDNFFYFDPPYESQNSVYGYDDFEMTEFVQQLDKLNIRGHKWMCSYYGSGDEGLDTVSKRKVLLESGPSSFRKLNKDGAVKVYEALYMNYE